MGYDSGIGMKEMREIIRAIQQLNDRMLALEKEWYPQMAKAKLQLEEVKKFVEKDDIGVKFES